MATSVNKNRTRDLYESIARAITPKAKNRKQRRKFERKIQRLRDRVVWLPAQ